MKPPNETGFFPKIKAKRFFCGVYINSMSNFDFFKLKIKVFQVCLKRKLIFYDQNIFILLYEFLKIFLLFKHIFQLD